MSDDDIVEKIRKKYERLSGVLDERSRRIWASAEAEALGYGGQTIVAKSHRFIADDVLFSKFGQFK